MTSYSALQDGSFSHWSSIWPRFCSEESQLVVRANRQHLILPLDCYRIEMEVITLAKGKGRGTRKGGTKKGY